MKNFSSSSAIFLCVVFCLISTINCAPAEYSGNATISEYCLEEAGISEEDVSNFDSSEEASEDLNCYFHCVFTQGGFIDDEGVVQVEKFEHSPDMPPINMTCVKELPKLLECNDIQLLENCNV